MKGRIALLGLLFGVLSAGLAACGGDSEEAPATVTMGPDGPSIVVSMKDHIFEPSRIVIPRDTIVRVRAVNEGSAVHNMLVDGGVDGSFRSDIRVSSGDESTFEVRMASPGTYRFTCGFHLPGMTGEFIVE